MNFAVFEKLRRNFLNTAGIKKAARLASGHAKNYKLSKKVDHHG
jgi:hypothetical protein